MISANRWYASISDVIKRPNEKGRLSSLIFEILALFNKLL